MLIFFSVVLFKGSITFFPENLHCLNTYIEMYKIDSGNYDVCSDIYIFEVGINQVCSKYHHQHQQQFMRIFKCLLQYAN